MDKLDELLQQWARKNTPPEARLDRVRRQIAGSVNSRPVTASAARPSLRGLARSRPLVMAGGLLSATTMVVAAYMAAPWHQNELVSGNSPDVPSVAIAEGDIKQVSRKTVLVDELQRLFAGQFEWIAEADGQTRIGLQEAEELAAETTPAVLVRLHVARRADSGSTWLPVWSLEVVSRSEQVVHLDGAPLKHGEVLLWAFPLPDGRLAVDAELNLDAPVPIRMTHNGVQDSGVPASVYSISHGDDEYQVFQTAVLLNRGTKKPARSAKES